MKILLGEVMIERDITYKELAELSGISKSTLHRIAMRSISPTMDNMERIAMALNMRITDLYDSQYK